MAHKAILLNKAFSGEWLKEKDHIGHEIIDLILTDHLGHYVYFAPWGSVPKNVIVEGDKTFAKPRAKQYESKYLVLSSPYNKTKKEVEIIYVIELKKQLHNLSCGKKGNNKKIEDNFTEIKKIIDKENIEYNHKKLYEIYPKYDEDGNRDRTLFVSFEAAKIYKPKTTLKYKFNQSIIRGNHFVLRDDDKYAIDYTKLSKYIDDNIKTKTLVPFTPTSLLSLAAKGFTSTFIDLIDYGDTEQAFTNILESILNQGNLLELFCKRFKKKSETVSKQPFVIKREMKVIGGRMDVCAQNKQQKVIIENKINSILNGKRGYSKTQLSTYYKWGKKKTTLSPLCFLLFPEIQEDKLKKDIAKNDKKMVGIYNLVTYGQFASFLNSNKSKIPASYEYYKYIDDIINAFKNLSYKTKEPYYAQKFLKATL